MSLSFDGSSPRPARFAVEARAEPGLLSRLLAPFSRRALEPDVMRARRRGETLHVRFALNDMPAELIQGIAGNLRQVVGVLNVRVESGHNDPL